MLRRSIKITKFHFNVHPIKIISIGISVDCCLVKSVMRFWFTTHNSLIEFTYMRARHQISTGFFLLSRVQWISVVCDSIATEIKKTTPFQHNARCHFSLTLSAWITNRITIYQQYLRIVLYRSTLEWNLPKFLFTRSRWSQSFFWELWWKYYTQPKWHPVRSSWMCK